jgi:glucan biosynthesis protein C
MSNRQYYLDWIRVGTILLVYFFHCGRFFDYGDWHVKNAAFSPAIDFFTYALVGWMMPMFFFISGASTWFALGAKSNKQFVSDRSKRIFIPLLMGILLLSPHQVYLERLTHHQFSGSFIDFIPHYFSGWYAFGGNFAWMGLHLWYLLLLFVYSLLTLPSSWRSLVVYFLSRDFGACGFGEAGISWSICSFLYSGTILIPGRKSYNLLADIGMGSW